MTPLAIEVQKHLGDDFIVEPMEPTETHPHFAHLKVTEIQTGKLKYCAMAPEGATVASAPSIACQLEIAFKRRH